MSAPAGKTEHDFVFEPLGSSLKRIDAGSRVILYFVATMEVIPSDRLTQALATAIGVAHPRIVVETGTYLGQGSTRIIASAFQEKPPEKFYTLEISRSYYEAARQNLSDLPYVEVLWGLSMGRSEAERFIREDAFLRTGAQSLHLKVDHSDPIEFYLREIRGQFGGSAPADDAPDHLLESILLEVREKVPLIALDSAGGIGWLEFQEVLRLQEGYPFVLFLDDVNHVKHHRSRLCVKSHPDFSIIDCDMNDGWLVAIYGRSRFPRTTLSATRPGW